MSAIRLAINGFGRIGRNAFKIALERKDVVVVALNDLTDTRTLAHLLKYDTMYGMYGRKVEYDEKHVVVDGKKIPVFAIKEPMDLPWKEHKVDVVIESTGRFTTEDGARAHLKAGAKRVIISAPGKGGNVPTFVRGVNDVAYAGQEIINNASCTTNCIAPVMAIMEARFGVEKAFMTTAHGYTADQNLQDGPHRDLRRARAAALNIVPTTTGAAIATTETLPQLKGKFDGIALRVPVATGSLSDFSILTKKSTTVEEVRKVFRAAAKNPLYKDVLQVTDDPIVSSDIIGNPASAIVDLEFIKVLDGNFVKILAWYDNEYGYSHRLIEMVTVVERK
ncbi:MAG: type I glyceraldehyde-3-phosphate dehydrogenase [Candidatus Magasanikbacteria bacterium]|nr:type I glyceraldehyde-3-phosphate dehydrogenase [Candidatus Magasanikbacteria bacterium]